MAKQQESENNVSSTLLVIAVICLVVFFTPDISLTKQTPSAEEPQTTTYQPIEDTETPTRYPRPNIYNEKGLSSVTKEAIEKKVEHLRLDIIDLQQELSQLQFLLTESGPVEAR